MTYKGDVSFIVSYEQGEFKKGVTLYYSSEELNNSNKDITHIMGADDNILFSINPIAISVIGILGDGDFSYADILNDEPLILQNITLKRHITLSKKSIVIMIESIINKYEYFDILFDHNEIRLMSLNYVEDIIYNGNSYSHYWVFLQLFDE